MISHTHYIIQGGPLKEGEQTRINHEKCKAGRDTKKRLYVKRTKDALVAYCHNCHDFGIYRTDVKNQKLSTRFLNRVIESTPKEPTAPVPADTVGVKHSAFDFAGRLWLAKYGLSDLDFLENYHVGYSLAYNRVILPFYEKVGGEMVCTCWQGRKLDDREESPKYLTMKGTLHKTWLYNGTGSPKFLVVTEDVISAIKANMFSHSLALLGTNCSPEQLDVMTHYPHVSLCLDNDEAGILAADQISKRLSILGVRHTNFTGTYGDKQYKDLSAEVRQNMLVKVGA